MASLLELVDAGRQHAGRGGRRERRAGGRHGRGHAAAVQRTCQTAVAEPESGYAAAEHRYRSAGARSVRAASGRPGETRLVAVDVRLLAGGRLEHGGPADGTAKDGRGRSTDRRSVSADDVTRRSEDAEQQVRERSRVVDRRRYHHTHVRWRLGAARSNLITAQPQTAAATTAAAAAAAAACAHFHTTTCRRRCARPPTDSPPADADCRSFRNRGLAGNRHR